MRTAIRCEFKIPGAFFPEEGSRTVDHRDPGRAVEELPANVYAFRFVTLTYLAATTELGETVELPPTRSDESGWYYPGGTIYDLAHVRIMAGNNPARYRTLLANMEGNGWGRLVRCRTGNWQPFEAGDELVTP